MWSTRLAAKLGRIFPVLSPYNIRVFLVFLLPYLLLVQYVRTRSYRDPTSAFFDHSSGYEPAYSKLRQEEANAFIDRANNIPEISRKKASDNPSMCVGIASVARNGTHYFKDAVGSVLDNLSDEEREDIYLILFIAQTNQSQHPAYLEPWFHDLPDQVLSYDNETVDIDHIRGLEMGAAKASGREKGLIDYTYLLKACEATNAPYTVILEDDVVASDGWQHRARRAIEIADEQSIEIAGSDCELAVEFQFRRADTVETGLYIRLFYTEQFLGWNSEDWPIYLFYSILITSLVACTLLSIRQCCPSTRFSLPNETILLLKRNLLTSSNRTLFRRGPSNNVTHPSRSPPNEPIRLLLSRIRLSTGPHRGPRRVV